MSRIADTLHGPYICADVAGGQKAPPLHHPLAVDVPAHSNIVGAPPAWVDIETFGKHSRGAPVPYVSGQDVRSSSVLGDDDRWGPDSIDLNYPFALEVRAEAFGGCFQLRLGSATK